MCLCAMDAIVDPIIRLLFQDLSDALLLFVVQFGLWELYVECYVQNTFRVVIVIVRHSFALLPDACAGPCDFVAHDFH